MNKITTTLCEVLTMLKAFDIDCDQETDEYITQRVKEIDEMLEEEYNLKFTAEYHNHLYGYEKISSPTAFVTCINCDKKIDTSDPTHEFYYCSTCKDIYCNCCADDLQYLGKCGHPVEPSHDEHSHLKD